MKFNVFKILLLCVCFSVQIQAKEQFIRFSQPEEVLDKITAYLPRNPIIIDSGAWVGRESILMAQKWPRGKVHSFEPVPEIYGYLVNETKKYGNIFTHACALSDKNGLAELFLSKMEGGGTWASSSLLAPKEHLQYAPAVQFPTTLTVETFTLDTWAKNHFVKRIDLMWLDMQGVELNVLKAAPEMLKTTKVIITEVEFVEAYEGQYLFKDVKEFLENEGFTLLGGNFDPKNPRSSHWYGDALFVRKSLLK